MKILVLNGSPRKGNSVSAIDAFSNGLKDEHEIEVVNTYDLNVAPCKGCEACECYKGCIDTDDSNEIVDKIVEADFVLFASPVYWWGITAQLKLVIDKCYCKGAALKGKNVGVIIVGGAETENVQYKLIKQQFECIAEFLSWDIRFHKSYSATGTEDLKNNITAIEEIVAIGRDI